jgi:hypothetical protein
MTAHEHEPDWAADASARTTPACACGLVAVNDGTDTVLWVTRAEAAAGLVRFARSLGPGTAACGEGERQALAVLRGE